MCGGPGNLENKVIQPESQKSQVESILGSSSASQTVKSTRVSLRSYYNTDSDSGALKGEIGSEVGHFYHVPGTAAAGLARTTLSSRVLDNIKERTRTASQGKSKQGQAKSGPKLCETT